VKFRLGFDFILETVDYGVLPIKLQWQVSDLAYGTFVVSEQFPPHRFAYCTGQWSVYASNSWL